MSKPIRAVVLTMACCVSLVACETTNPYRNAHPLPRNAVHLLLEARGEWARARAATDPAERRTHDGRARAKLRDAIAIAPRCPLLAGRLGDLLREDGALEAAARCYSEAIALSEDWVPGHLGLAMLELNRKDYRTARRHLDNAGHAIVQLQTGIAARDDPAFEILGLRFGGPEVPDPFDAAPDRRTGYGLTLTMLHEDSLWSIDNGALLGPGKGVRGTAAGVMSHFKARALLLRANLTLRAGGGTEQERLRDGLAELEEAAAFDGDDFEVQLNRGWILYESRDFARAWKVLELLLEGARRDGNRMILANEMLASLMTSVAVEAFLLRPDTETRSRCAEFFEWLERHHGSHKAGLLRSTQELFAASRAGSAGRLEQLRESVEGERWNETDAPLAASLEKEIRRELARIRRAAR